MLVRSFLVRRLQVIMVAILTSIDEAGVVAALVALGAKMAKADGSVSKSEVDAFKRVFQASPENEETIGRFLI